ncbi:MAG TPA: hypothetical protein VKB93_03715 [Thermoanaerobaculia bacterium]|nr:hypothetical protein [Thermoanaerobaculia bacterium]
MLVREIGDAHVRVAVRSLSDRTVSRRPARELGIAIGALQQAYETYAALTKRLENKWFFASDEKIAEAREKTVECLLLIATCYHYEKDVALRKRYLRKAMIEFDWYLVHVGGMPDTRLDEEDD